MPEERPNLDVSTRLMRTLVPMAMNLTGVLRRRPRAPYGIEQHRYGSDPDERLEIIAPRDDVPQHRPVVYFHGGGWILGTKESYTRHLTFLAEAGYPVINVEYPLAPDNPHPGILRSLLRALDWIAERQPDGVHVAGDSAGGNLAMMVGLLIANPQLLKDVEPARTEAPVPCISVVSIYGVLDRLTWIEDGFPGSENMLECYGGKAAFEATVPPELALTPDDLVFTEAPPSLLTVGTKDPLRRSSALFAKRLAAGPGRVAHKEYPDEPHGFFSLGSSKHADEMNADILEFLSGVDPARP